MSSDLTNLFFIYLYFFKNLIPSSVSKEIVKKEVPTQQKVGPLLLIKTVCFPFFGWNLKLSLNSFIHVN